MQTPRVRTQERQKLVLCRWHESAGVRLDVGIRHNRTVVQVMRPSGAAVGAPGTHQLAVGTLSPVRALPAGAVVPSWPLVP